MNRRRLLALAGVGVGAPSGYLAWEWYHSPTLPDGMDVDTRHTIDFPTFVVGEDWGDQVRSREERYHVFADADAADDAIRTTSDSITSFVNETDFGVSYLLVVQNGMSSDLTIELDTIERVDDGIHVEITIDEPLLGIDDDFITHSFLLRITDTKDNVSEVVTVDIEGYI